MGSYPNGEDILKSAGEEIYIVGSGASLYGFDFSKLVGKTVIACNHAFQYVPDPTYIIYLDTYFFVKELSEPAREKLISLKDRVWTPFVYGAKSEFNVFRFTPNHTGKFGEVWAMFAGKSCGLAALSFALTLNPSKIYLLGLDGKILSESEISTCFAKNTGKNSGITPRMVHFSDADIPHRHKEVIPNIENLYHLQANRYNEFSRYREKIVNLSEYSDIPTFRKVPHWDHFSNSKENSLLDNIVAPKSKPKPESKSF